MGVRAAEGQIGVRDMEEDGEKRYRQGKVRL